MKNWISWNKLVFIYDVAYDEQKYHRQVNNK